MKKVAVIMGSDSDWPVVKGACEQLQSFGIPFEAHILSAHRTPAAAADFAKSARENGFGVLICAAGMAAHLAGAFAGNSTLPVIGIPMKGGAMDGLDALLATVQMPSGIPVATVAINGAKNAAVPVSYTHLDVYKRQAYGFCGGAHPRHPGPGGHLQ